MNEDIKGKILEKIRAYRRIILCRHTRPDGDALGATFGLRRILRLSYPEKEVFSIGTDASAHLDFLGKDDPALPEEAYRDALVIMIDTGTPDRAADPLAFCAKELIKIDHHIEEAPYGDLRWVESERSSSCEMIAALRRSFPDELRMDPMAATLLYTGIVTDTGRFRYSCTSGETLRIAGELLEYGVETESLFSRLYLEDFSKIPYRSYVYANMKKTENGVLSVYVSQETQKALGLSAEETSEAILYMEGFRGCLIWLAFLENEDGTTRVRLRSRFVTVNELAARHHGGGHDRASGATVYSKEEMDTLIAEADALVSHYMATEEGWI